MSRHQITKVGLICTRALKTVFPDLQGEPDFSLVHPPKLFVSIGDDRLDEPTQLVRRQAELFAADAGTVTVAAAAVVVLSRVPSVELLEIGQVNFPVLLRNREGAIVGIWT